jgi:hypothetical protein
MRITRLTYTYMEQGCEVRVCTIRTVDSDVQAYMHDHVAKLKAKVEAGRNSTSEFTCADTAERFEQLLNGTDEQFLEAANSIATDIQVGMRGNARSGLCVAMTVDDDDTKRAAVLKLEVLDKNAGILREIAEGTRELEAVHNLLVRPKDLQKGGLYPDPRPNSDLIVGDALDTAALYFLDGLGVIQEQSPSESVVALRKAVARRHPDKVDDLYGRFLTSEAESIGTFVEQNADLFDDEAERLEVVAELEGRGRPVRVYSPGAARGTIRTVVAGNLKVTGPLSEMSGKVSWERRKDGLWEITLLTQEEPHYLD